MKVTKKTESIFEIEFDEYEVEKLKDLEIIFDMDPTDFLRRSFEQNLQNCTANIDYLIQRVRSRVEQEGDNITTSFDDQVSKMRTRIDRNNGHKDSTDH